MPDKDFHHISYEIHQQSYGTVNIDAELKLYKTWFTNGTVDVWRHPRMLDNIIPFLQKFPGAKWLTVADGRFGTAAIYINSKGGNALPTDIDVSLLKVAKEYNMISRYQYENAEALSFDDNSFDFCLCKESFHHFPRAYIALYEMLRVSRKAVILIEPRDWLPSPLPRRILQLIKNTVKKALGKKILHPDTGNYEPEGNYVFTVSEREIQKIAVSVNLPAVAFKSFQDVYIEGVEHEKATESSALFKKIKKQIFYHEVLVRLGLAGTNQIAAIIFKESLDEQLESEFKKIGFNIIQLPENPYV